MITFFCTRCGTALEVDDFGRAGQPVRCANCNTVVRTPDVASDIPVARAAAPRLEDFPAGPEQPEEPPFTTPFDGVTFEPLDYGIASYPAPRFRDESALDEMAERLGRVEHDLAEGEDGMTECKVCGSTIAGFVRKCPFCRNALHGRA